MKRTGSAGFNIELEALRGMAALFVVLGHARFFGRQASHLDILGTTLIEKILLLPTGVASSSVALFFVLSGYLVGGQVVRQLEEGNFNFKRYLLSRITRLTPVLICSILVTRILDALSVNLGPLEPSWEQGVGRSDVFTLTCNLVFLQPARCKPFGSNDALWSVGYEFWFYIFFGAAALAVFALKRKIWKIATFGTLLAVFSVFAFGVDLLIYIFSWIVGVLVSIVEGKCNFHKSIVSVISSRGIAAASLCLLFSTMLFVNIFDISRPLRLAVVGIVSSIFILLIVIRKHEGLGASRSVKILAKIGPWSYTLYAFHLPIMLFVINVLTLGGIKFTVFWIFLLATLVGCLAYPFYHLVEKHSKRIRNYLFRVFGLA